MGNPLNDVSPLANFYAPPNDVDPARLQGPADELLRVMMARLDGASSRTLLPARVDGRTRWYGIAPSAREARLLLEEMRSWLGPPLSRGPRSIERSTDAVDTAASLVSPSSMVLRVDITTGWHTAARENVSSLLDVWTLTPERGLDLPRPVGRVLRQFYESLLAADRSAAETALDEIRARALLTPTNVRFLRVELLSTLGSPVEIRDDPSLRGISLLSRPPAVTDRLATAADALLVAPALARGADSAEWTLVAQQLEEAWPGLVTHPSQVTSVAGARCLALAEILASEPRHHVLASLADDWSDDDVVGVLAEKYQPPGQSKVQPHVGALELYHAGEYELALTTIEADAPDRRTAAVALAAAVNLGDSGSATRALTLVERLATEDREQLLEQAVERVFHEQLLGRTADARVPDGWLTWLTEDWPDRPDLLSDWASSWDRSPHELTRSAQDIATELLDALNDGRRSRVRNGLPVFTEWLLGPGDLDPGAVSLATTVLDIMLSSEPGRIERQAALLLLDEVFAAGCSSAEYSEVLDAISRQLHEIGPRDAAWLAQCLDLILLSASPKPATKAAVLSTSFALVQSWGDRVDRTEEVLLKHVFHDAGMEIPDRSGRPDEEPSNGGPTKSFRSVGIYSLLEPAARIAARWITETWPGVQVKLSHDHVNSRALESIVQSSDVMLVQTSRAKHAATHAIETASTSPSTVVLVHGRGATSLLRALLLWSRSGFAQP